MQYHRLNCSKKCIFPTYGVECQSQCKCSKEKCNFVTGCFQGVEEATDNQLRKYDLYLSCELFRIQKLVVLEAVNIKTGLFHCEKYFFKNHNSEIYLLECLLMY